MLVKQNPPRLDTTELNSLSPRTGGMDPRRRTTVDCRWRLKICVLFFSCETCSERSQSLRELTPYLIISFIKYQVVAVNWGFCSAGGGRVSQILAVASTPGATDKVATGGCSARGRTNQRWCLECAYPQWAGSLVNICVHVDRRLLPT